MYVWGVSRKTIPMQINVVGTVMLLVSVLIVVGGEVNSRRRRRALEAPRRKARTLAGAR
jgi:spermidine/putrescine transport system permease protein